MDTWTEVVPWPEKPTWRALMAYEDGAPYPATWAVQVTWARTDRTLTPVGIDVRSYTTHDGHVRPTMGGLQRVTARGLRDVNVGQVVEQARTQIQARQIVVSSLAQALLHPEAQDHLLHPVDSQKMANLRDRAQELRDAVEGAQRGRGRPAQVTLEHLEEVAHVYRQGVATGSRKPVRLVAEHFGITDPNDFRPKGWVQAARKRGLIN